MKVIAFAASSSKKSINKQLVSYAVSLIENAESEVLDLNDFEMPLFSEDKEAEIGQPELAKTFLAKIEESDALVIAFAEHNGCYSAAYKNLFDWCSRITPKVFQGKPVIFLSTSPGARGGASVLALAVNSAPFFGASVKGSYSIGKFYECFDSDKKCIINPTIDAELIAVMNSLNLS